MATELVEDIGPRAARLSGGRSTCVLRGRDEHLVLIGELLGDVAVGRGAALLLEGPAGAGKTSLLRETRSMASRLRVASVTATGGPRDDDRPPARTLRELPWSRPAAEGALAVTVDDLHTADDRVLAGLRTVVDSATEPILWVMTCLSTTRRRSLADLVSSLERAGAHRLSVGPLAHDAVAAMVADRLGAEPGPALVELAARACGRPDLVAALIDGLLEEGRLRCVGGIVHVHGDVLPARAADAVRATVRGLSTETRELLRMGSVLGHAFSAQVVSTMLQRPPSALVAAVEEAVAAGLLVDAGEQLAFSHEMWREAAFQEMPTALRRALRREAATVLLGRGTGQAQAAAALADSCEVGDTEAVAMLVDVARGQRRSNRKLAAEINRRALDLLPAHAAERGTLTAETILLLHSAMRLDDAMALADEALAGDTPAWPSAPVDEASIRLSLSALLSRAPAARAAENRRALALPDLPPALGARHRAWLAINLAPSDQGEALATAHSAETAARSCGDTDGLAVADLAIACADACAGRPLRALRRVERLRSTARRAIPEPAGLLADLLHARLLADLGEPGQALRLAAAGRAVALRTGDPFAQHCWQVVTAACELCAGRLAEARVTAAAVEDVQLPGTGETGRMIAATLADVALETGELGALVALERRLRRDAEMGDVAAQDTIAPVLAISALARDDPRRAAALWRRATSARLPLWMPENPGQLVRVARVAVAAGDDMLARRAVGVADARRRDNPGVALFAAIATHVRALVAGDAASLSEAARLLRPTELALVHAAAAEDAGRALEQEGRPADAVAALTDALDGYTTCGAVAAEGRVRRLLGHLGVRPRASVPRTEVTGWDSLTEAEMRVVHVVARGATNRAAAAQLYLSRHTVSSHLRHAFEKLDINSRVQLAMLYTEREAGRDDRSPAFLAPAR